AGELAACLEPWLDELARAAEAEGLWVLGGGVQPFAALDELPRVPKERYGLMRAHFERLGEAARRAPEMMLATQSLQASFDWDDEADGARTLEAALRTGPPLAALVASSPVLLGRKARARSSRLEIWRGTDPSRTGVVAAALEPGAGYGGYVAWALDRPLVLRVVEGRYVAAPAG